MRYFYNNDYQDSKEYFEELISQEYHLAKNSNKKFSFSVIKLYYLCLLYLGSYDEILEASKDWKNLENYGWVAGTSRATALKRKIEYKQSDVCDSIKIIEEILNIFNYVFEKEQYIEAACVEANKIVKSINYIVEPSLGYTNELIKKYLDFVSKHFFNILANLRNENINSTDNQIFIASLYKVTTVENP